MSRRNYHEIKAVRCITALERMKQKLHRLEGIRVQKIEDIKKERDAILKSTVTLKCEGCGKQFVVTFTSFMAGKYVKICNDCKYKENKLRVDKVKHVLTQAGIPFEVRPHYIEIKHIHPDVMTW